MISILIYDRNQQERELISRDCRSRVAQESSEQLRLESTEDDRALLTAAGGEHLLHLLYYDFQKGQTLDTLRRFRRDRRDSMVMLITDAEVSPLEYLRPGVNPDSLLLRPVDVEKLRTVNREFLRSFFMRFKNHDAEARFLVDTREEKVLIPYSQIYYFEARDKKLYVRLQNEEYAFYDTIEGLERRLPEGFRRCHRSYIVNIEKIRRMVPGENYIELEGQVGVPVSRSYKAAFKELGT